MMVVIDINRIFASLLKDGTTRSILLHPLFDFIAPDQMAQEVESHLKSLTTLTGKTIDELRALLSLIFRFVRIFPGEFYRNNIEQYKEEIEDPADLPFFALCGAALAEGIWTHDRHLLKQKKVKTFTNIDMLSFVR